MALIVFLRGINVGGHRTLRPSVLARELAAYDVVNIGAAGTFIVLKPDPRAGFLAELRSRLPFHADVACCDSRELERLIIENPWGTEPAGSDVVRFVSILSKTSRRKVSLPAGFPPGDGWFVRILGAQGRLVFGLYRRHMRTIGHLSQIDELFGVPATVRSSTTVDLLLKKVQFLENRCSPERISAL